MGSDTAVAAFRRRKDLKQYGGNGLLLFALETILRLDDIHTVAADALTDGSDDKKCDLLYVDRDAGRAIIAQSYYATRARKSAPSNKAGDLNTAVAWLLAADVAALPRGLQAAGIQLDQALRDGVIRTIELWYCHNLVESVNVQRELEKVKSTADSLLRRNYSGVAPPGVSTQEIGKSSLEEAYRSTKIPIVISETLDVVVGPMLETKGDGWEAVTASVPLTWLHGLFLKHGRKLFSANVRDYLGSRRSDRNINHRIKETARTLPGRFWPYNNGITALVTDFALAPSGRVGTLRITGIAVVNGAQTTGAVGQLRVEELGSATVLARFVKTERKDIVEDIITFNNTQNKIDPADFRSNDAIQERLRREFLLLPGMAYAGFRRGGEEDRIRRPQNVVPSQTAGQALVAFHQDPNLAYNEKSQIWEADAKYGHYYCDRLCARHLVFCLSLLRAVETAKKELMNKADESRTQSEKSQADFFRQRGATFLLTAGVAACLEVFLGRAIGDPFRMAFSKTTTLEAAIAAWRPIVGLTLPFTGRLMSAASAGVKNDATIKADIETFRSLVEATRGANVAVIGGFAKKVQSMPNEEVIGKRARRK